MVCPRYKAIAISGMCVFAANIVMAQVQDAGRSSAEETARLIKVIESDVAMHDKAMACRRLAVIGNQDAVPALAALLVNDRLATYARSGLEVIPHPSASAALREAIGRLEGKLLIGVLGSIGKRRDTQAIDALTKLLASDDQAVATSAARALGYIGNAKTAQILQMEFAQGTVDSRSAVATACLICAGRLEQQGHRDRAMALYDKVRQADVPQHLKLAATHRLIVGQGRVGLPLLDELLGSANKSQFRFALQAARDLGTKASGTIIAQLDESPAPRRALLIVALSDIGDASTLPAILEQAQRGAKEVRIQALQALVRFDDPVVASTLLKAATTSDQDIATVAQSSLSLLENAEIDSTIVNMLQSDSDTSLQAAVVIAGLRNIVEATPALFKLANQSDVTIQSAAIKSLGSTIQAEDLPKLIALVIDPKTSDQRATGQEALRAACSRLSREDSADSLTAAMSDATIEAKELLLEQIATVGGPRALAAVVAAARSHDDVIQDTATRLLGEWLTADAAPKLLDLTKTLSQENYRIRTLRGYLRIARQLNMTLEERVEVCRNALAIADRNQERRLALDTLGRIRSPQALALAVSLLQDKQLKESACSAIVSMADGVAPLAPDETEKALRQVIVVTAQPALKQQATTKIAKARELAR